MLSFSVSAIALAAASHIWGWKYFLKNSPFS